MKRHLVAILLLIGGCVSPRPHVNRYQILSPVPEAHAGDVVLKGPDESGWNTYNIDFFAITNAGALTSSDTGYYGAMYWYITTNKWPYIRNNIDLSLDGGKTYPVRLGFGLKTDPSGFGGRLIWSPPQDYSLLTTNAVLKITNLQGDYIPTTSYHWPFEWPSNSFCVSESFRIIGGHILAPAQSDILWRGQQTTVTWYAIGTGTSMDLYWVTPDDGTMDLSHWVTKITSCKDGTNSKIVSLNVPVADQIELVLIASSNNLVRCYSKPFTVDP